MSHGNETTHEGFMPRINEVAQKYVDELMKEKSQLPKNFPLCAQVIDDAIDRIYATGRIPGKEIHADVYKQIPIKVSQNVYLPVKQFPKFNFMGKLIGPKGNTLRSLNQETLCNIAIKGRTSMRDEEKEEMLRQSKNPVYNHLNKNLFVELSTVAPPAEAYARISYALAEIRRYIIPDKNDEISQEQYRELMEMHPEYAKKKSVMYKSVFEKLQGQDGLRAAQGYNQEEYKDEYESPPSPPSISKNATGFRAGPPRRPNPSSFQERVRGFRQIKPYQGFAKNMSFKKNF